VRARSGKKRAKQVLSSDDSEIEIVASKAAEPASASRQKAPASTCVAVTLDSDGEIDVPLSQRGSAKKPLLRDADTDKARTKIPRDAGGKWSN
jgi:hypothetical protein